MTEIEIDLLDESVAEIAWNINRSVENPTNELIESVETLFKIYQKYVKGDSSLRAKVERLATEIGQKMNSRVHNLVQETSSSSVEPRRIYAMDGKKKSSGAASAAISSDVVERSSSDYDIVHQRVQAQANRDAGASRLENLENMMFQLMKAQVASQEQLTELTSSLPAKLDYLAHNSNVSNSLAVSTEKLSRKQAEQMDKLYESQMMASGDIFDVPFMELPNFIKKSVTKNFKKLMFEAVKLPYTILKKTTSNLIYHPMLTSFQSVSKWLEIIWGFALWAIVIGGAIQFYYTGDFTTVNNLYEKYGGNFVVGYVIYPVVEVSKYLKDYAVDVVIWNWEFWIKGLGEQFVQSLTGYASIVLGSISEFIKNSVTTILTPSTWAPWWLGGRAE